MRIKGQWAKERKLDKLYAELPKLECQGKCQAACGVILMTEPEWQRIVKRVGHQPRTYDLVCPMLSRVGRCSIYDVRPAICRLWGCVDDPKMRCPHGCEPERWMTAAEGHAWLRNVEEVANGRS